MSEWTDIGEQLRNARESKGLDLKDVAHTTRIPLSTLTALEESDYSIFPSPTYARSFLSQYSEYLNVDAHEWIDAFETGDVLSNVNDHGYLQSHNEHVGEHRHNPEPARRRGRSSSRLDSPPSEKGSGRGSSILQTLTVFFVTALLIGGGIYAYKKYEPMLKGALNEETEDKSGDSSEAPATTPPSTDKPSVDPKQTPPLVAKNDPPTTDGGSDKGTTPNTPATKDQPEDGQQPVIIEPNRTGKPPKAMVIEEDE